jgi:large subunit ribosomal protein L18
MSANRQQDRRRVRRYRVRAKVNGTSARPRLSVFRSARHIYAQIVDDTAGRTLAAASSRLPEDERKSLESKLEGKGKLAVSTAVGKLLAERGLAQGIKKVCFDRSGYRYHGRVKALADGARAGGLEF